MIPGKLGRPHGMNSVFAIDQVFVVVVVVVVCLSILWQHKMVNEI